MSFLYRCALYVHSLCVCVSLIMNCNIQYCIFRGKPDFSQGGSLRPEFVVLEIEEWFCPWVLAQSVLGNENLK